jgi:hypothetical protein
MHGIANTNNLKSVAASKPTGVTFWYFQTLLITVVNMTPICLMNHE